MPIHRAAAKAFAVFLRLYPSRFQSEFGPEIMEVFSESVLQAERKGVWPAFAVALREVVDFPINLAGEYWEEYHMQTLALSQPVLRPVWWGAVGFGLTAALANLISTFIGLQPVSLSGGVAAYWFPWGECVLYAVLGGLGGLLFALTSQPSGQARLCLLAGTGGFLIGHLLWFPVSIGSFILIGRSALSSTSSDALTLAAFGFIRLLDLVLVVSATGFIIGWMKKNRHQALRLAGSAAMGAVLGGLLGLGFCGILFLIGIPVVGEITFITSLEFIVNSVGGILGGALLGRAIGRKNPFRELPAAS